MGSVCSSGMPNKKQKHPYFFQMNKSSSNSDSKNSTVKKTLEEKDPNIETVMIRYSLDFAPMKEKIKKRSNESTQTSSSFLTYVPNSVEILKSKGPYFFDHLQTFNKDNIVALEVIEEGGFGLLRRVYDKEKDQEVLLKTFDKRFFEDFADVSLSDAILEDHVLQKVDNLKENAHFLKYYGALIDPEKRKEGTKLTISSLILEKESGLCTLEDLTNVGMVYEGENLRNIMTYLAKGFYILQRNGIALRDVKLSNIFLAENSEKNGFHYKISHFSISCLLFESVTILSTEAISGCSKMYAAPEVERHFFNRQHSTKTSKKEDYDPFRADVFSLGVCFLKLMGFGNPKKELEDGLINKPTFIEKYHDVQKVFANMLCEDFAQRCDFKQLWILLTGSEDLSFELKKIQPNLFLEEKKHFEKWREEKEKSKIVRTDDLLKLFYEHKVLFQTYEKSRKKQSDAEYHLEKAWTCLNQYKEKVTNITNTNNATIENDKYDEKEEVFCMREIANMMRKRGFYSKATELLRECLLVCDHIYKKNDTFDSDYMVNEDYADCFLQMALNLMEMDKETEAEENCKQSLNLLLMNFGQNNVKTAKAYHILGLINEKLEDFEKAEENYLKVLKIGQEISSGPLSMTADCYHRLGGIYFHQENPEKAEEYYQKSLEIQKSLYGTCHLDIAASYVSLAGLYKEIWDFEKAEEFYNEAIKIYGSLFGESNKKTEAIHEILIDLYVIMGNIKKKEKKFKEAEEIYNKALKIAQKSNSIYCLVLSDNLKNLYLDGIIDNLEK